MYSRKYILRKVLGAYGELRAKRYLKKQGIYHLTSNFRTNNGEVDFIGFFEKNLVIAEVKLRTTDTISGYQAVGKRKKQTMLKVAEQYCTQMNYFPKRIRLDIVSIYLNRKFPFKHEIVWLQDVDQ